MTLERARAAHARRQQRTFARMFERGSLTAGEPEESSGGGGARLPAPTPEQLEQLRQQARLAQQRHQRQEEEEEAGEPLCQL